MRRRELTIPTILGIFVSVIGMGVGVWFLREPIKTAVFADAKETPSEVQLTNVTDSSFVVSWTTAKAVSGYIQYGEGTNPSLVVSDDRDQERGTVENYFTHYVTVRGLRPTTSYSFRIGSGGKTYDQQGSLYQASTGHSLGSPPAADVAYGQVLTASGEPAEGAIVYLSLPGAITQAGLVKSGGSWVIPLSTARSADLTSYAAYDLETGQISLVVQGGSLGSSQVLTTTSQDSPIPAISLGQSYNYITREDQNETGSQTEADTNLGSGSSRFSSGALGQAAESASSLAIVSPKFNEQVNSTQPEIIGRGPANSEITITIESPTTISETIATDASGNFSYSVPQDLAAGEHTITISAIVDGVSKQIQRHFTVMAAGESTVPAFTATPSATIRPSPTPTLAPRVSLPSTQSGVPTSGNLTPTLVLLILGSGLILSGGLVYKKLS